MLEKEYILCHGHGRGALAKGRGKDLSFRYELMRGNQFARTQRKREIFGFGENILKPNFLVKKFDDLVKVNNTPSPLMGEGRVRVKNLETPTSYFPPPFHPLPPGEGKLNFFRLGRMSGRAS